MEQEFSKGGIHIVLRNSKQKCSIWKRHLEDRGFKVQLFNRDTGYGCNEEIIKPDTDIVLATTYLRDGLNIYNDKVTKMHLYSNDFSALEIYQFASRVRNATPDVIVWTEQREAPDIEDFDSGKAFQDMNDTVKRLNTFIQRNASSTFFDEVSDLMDARCGLYNCLYASLSEYRKSLVIFNEDTQKFEGNFLGILHLKYRNEKAKQRADFETFKSAMEEYDFEVTQEYSVLGSSIDLDSHKEQQFEEDQELLIQCIENDLLPALKEDGSGLVEIEFFRMVNAGERSIKKEVFNQYRQLSMFLKNQDEIISIIQKNQFKSIMKKWSDMHTYPSYYLRSKLSDGISLNNDSKFALIDELRHKVKEMNLPVNTLRFENDMSLLSKSKKVNCYLNRFITGKTRRIKRNTETVYEVESLQPFPFQIKESALAEIDSIHKN
jgi:glutaredoxin-related protein